MIKKKLGYLRNYIFSRLHYTFSDTLRLLPRRIYYKYTYRCNLHCRMCAYVDRYEGKYVEMDYNNVKEVFSGIKEAYRGKLYLPYITITGGEPFIMDDLNSLLVYLEELGFRVEVVTNATMIDESHVKTLLESKNVTLQVSLDGTAEVHNSVRGGQNCFGISISNLEKLFSGGFPFNRVVFNYAISSLNYTSINDFVEYILGLGWKPNFEFEFLNNFTTGASLESLKAESHIHLGDENIDCCFEETELNRVDADVLSDQIIKVRETGKRNNANIVFKPSIPISRLNDYFYSYDDYIFTDRCLEPWRSLRMGPDGMITPCGIEYEFGNINANNLNEIYYSDKAVRFRKMFRNKNMFSVCRRCCKLKGREYY